MQHTTTQPRRAPGGERPPAHRNAPAPAPQPAATGAPAPGEEPSAHGHPVHRHAFHQFLYVPLGHITVTAEGRDHRLSPSVALWVPAGLPHSARFDPDSLVLSEDFEPAAHPLPYRGATAVDVDERLRRMLLARMRAPEPGDGGDALFAALTATRERCLALPRPTSEPARTVAEELRKRPDHPYTAVQWAERMFTSATSLRRAFRMDTGLAFSEWRTRLRLNHSLDLLSEGRPIGAVAARVGFASTNGYILAFRRHFGCTPGAYARESGGAAR
ncbi:MULTISPECIES: AraC family transcriptional regulator [unclassified Streptomyces]|uniref:helix-turn-helix transcriptional regulator n=1 Tax=unclassified Streptomyces TaxID=2593676 RepID=UPI0034279CB8